MSNILLLRKKISTIKNIQKVTRAVKMVATVRARKAQQVLQISRIVPQHISEIMAIIAKCGEYEKIITHPLIMPKKELLRTTILIVSNDHGLCGGFATKVCTKALEIMSKKDAGKEYTIISVGNKGTSFLKNKKIKIYQEHLNFFVKYKLDKVYNLADSLVNLYLSNSTDEVITVYTSLRPSYVTEVVAQRLLPVPIEEIAQIKQTKSTNKVWILEPDIKTILNKIIRLYLVSELNKIFHESFASEQLARMQTMDMASTNAEKLLEKVKILFNKTRQELITKEVIEVISGSNNLQ